jgi:serine/threonine-protein phosphatase 2A activator
MVAAAHATRGSAAAVAAEAAKSGMRAPVKLLSGPQDLPRWQQSQARADVLGFILALNDAVKSKAADAPREPSAACRLIVDELRRLRDLVATIPPIQQATRYGNKSFRDWLGRLMQGSAAFHQRLLSRELFEAGAAEELGGYWVECFGNVVRIDYGTGHELCFAAWLCVLAKLRVLTVSDSLSIVFDVFVTYLDLMRTVQR